MANESLPDFYESTRAEAHRRITHAGLNGDEPDPIDLAVEKAYSDMQHVRLVTSAALTLVNELDQYGLDTNGVKGHLEHMRTQAAQFYRSTCESHSKGNPSNG